MGEICAAVARYNLINKPHLAAGLSLERHRVNAFGRSKLMPFHVKYGSSDKLSSHETLVECACSLYLCHQRVRNHLTCLIVAGIFSKHFPAECPVFHYLRGKFHKIARHCRSAHAFVAAFAQKPVQRMPELMEHCPDLVKSKERRLVCRRLCEIAYIYDDRTHINTVSTDFLVDEVAHPCPASLGAAREIIRQKHSYQRPVGISDFESLDIRMIRRDILKFLKIEPIKLVSSVEHTLTDIFHFEIRLGLLLIKRILGLAYLFRIPCPVPRLYSAALRKDTCLDVLIHDGLHVSYFLTRLCHCRNHQVSKEFVNRSWSAGHFVRKYKCGRSVVTEQPGLFYFQ